MKKENNGKIQYKEASSFFKKINNKKRRVNWIMGMLSLVGKAKATLEVSPKLHRLINKTNTKN